MKFLLIISITLVCHFTLSAQCSTDKRPIIFIHGFLGSGDTYAGQIQRFINAGYCPNRLFVFDWNSVGGNPKITDSLLNQFIDEVLTKTKASQVDIAGHSAGGGIGRNYLADSFHSLKVAHYVHIGSRKWKDEYSWFPNSKCLNIWSAGDRVMGNAGADVEGAVNVGLKEEDHYEVATCYKAWSAMFYFFNNQKVGDTVPPSMETISRDNRYSLAGKAVLLGDNTPMKNAAVVIWSVDQLSGKRINRTAEKKFIISEDGAWGPFITKKSSYYELELIPEDINQRTISYFIGKVENDNHHLYLRGFPKGNMIGMMLGNIPAKENESVIVIYSASKATIAGRDSVTVNLMPVSSPLLTPAGKTIISSFIFDDGDSLSSGKLMKQFSSAPFISGVDISLPVSKAEKHIVYYNGKSINLPAVSSKERILLVVFN